MGHRMHKKWVSIGINNYLKWASVSYSHLPPVNITIITLRKMTFFLSFTPLPFLNISLNNLICSYLFLTACEQNYTGIYYLGSSILWRICKIYPCIYIFNSPSPSFDDQKKISSNIYHSYFLLTVPYPSMSLSTSYLDRETTLIKNLLW